MSKKLLNKGIQSIRDLKSVKGAFVGIEKLTNEMGEAILSKAYGNELFKLLLSDENGEVNEFWADAGLRGSLKMGRVSAGMKIEIVHTGEKEIDAGTVQTYDIFGE